MCVHYTCVESPAERGDRRALRQIPTAADDERLGLHPSRLQRREERSRVARRRERRRDDDAMPRAPLRTREGGHDGLEPPYRSRGQQMQDSESGGQ